MPDPVSSTKIYYLFYKPYDVLCQFTDGLGRKTLKDFGPFPKNTYSVGRLDLDSEGLLLITNDNEVNHRLTEPSFEHPRTYLAQVDGIPSLDTLDQLKHGVMMEGKQTKPISARLLHHEPNLPQRVPAIRYRKNIPTAWIEITLYEGRNRQVRKMTAAIGHPTLRLVRTGIGMLLLGGLQPGESRRLTKDEGMGLRRFVGF